MKLDDVCGCVLVLVMLSVIAVFVFEWCYTPTSGAVLWRERTDYGHESKYLVKIDSWLWFDEAHYVAADVFEQASPGLYCSFSDYDSVKYNSAKCTERRRYCD